MCRFIRRQTLARRTFCRQTPAGRSIPCVLHLDSSAVGRGASHWVGREEGDFRRSFPPILARRGCFNAWSIVFNTPGAAVRAVNQRGSGCITQRWSGCRARQRSPFAQRGRNVEPGTGFRLGFHLMHNKYHPKPVCTAAFSCASASPAGKLPAPSHGMLRSRTLLPAPGMSSVPLGCRYPRTRDSSAFPLAARTVVLRLLSIISDLEGGSSLFRQAETRLCASAELAQRVGAAPLQEGRRLCEK